MSSDTIWEAIILMALSLLEAPAMPIFTSLTQCGILPGLPTDHFAELEQNMADKLQSQLISGHFAKRQQWLDGLQKVD